MWTVLTMEIEILVYNDVVKNYMIPSIGSNSHWCGAWKPPLKNKSLPLPWVSTEQHLLCCDYKEEVQHKSVTMDAAFALVRRVLSHAGKDSGKD